MKKRFSEEQIIGFLKEADAGLPVTELCRKHGFSDASYYKWKAKFGGMEVSDARRLKALEEENNKLKRLLADAMLDRAGPAKLDSWLSGILASQLMPKGRQQERA
jgi:putative transposase